MIENLHCPRCQDDKPVGEFNRNAARTNGFDNYCRACMREAERRRRESRKNQVVPPESRCAIDGCEDRRKGHGYCNRHLKRFRQYGNPLAGRKYERKTGKRRRPDGQTLIEAFRWFMPGNPPAEGIPWLWTGPVDGKGYGLVRHGGRNIFAHRISYELFVGPIPDGLIIRHKNDTPLDVNPHNLEVGTLVDNVRDRVERGRSARGALSPEAFANKPRGAASGMSKLTDQKVQEIRRMYADGFSQAHIGKQFGISQVNVSCIVRRKTWAHVP